MNWFERHLNGTAFWMAVGGAILIAGVPSLIISPYVLVLERFFDLSFSFTIILGVIIVGCLSLSAIGYGWILKKKNRSAGFLGFYVIIIVGLITAFLWQYLHNNNDGWLTQQTGITPEALPSLISPFTWIIESRDYLTIVPDAVFFFLTFGHPFIYGIAWFVLILLGHRQDNKEGILCAFFSGKRALLTTAIIAVVVTGMGVGLGLFVRFGYLHFDSSQRGLQSTTPHVSFDYPANGTRPVLLERYMVKGLPVNGNIHFPRAFSSDSNLVFNSHEYFLQITFFTSQEFELIRAERSETDREAAVYLMKYYEDYDKLYTTDVSDVIINGLPAIKVTGYRTPGAIGLWETNITVGYESSGYFWMLTWKSEDDPFEQQPRSWSRFLDTFTVYD